MFKRNLVAQFTERLKGVKMGVKLAKKAFFAFYPPDAKSPQTIGMQDFLMELLEGIEPSNLILTKDALCRLSYSSLFNFLGKKLTPFLTPTGMKSDKTTYPCLKSASPKTIENTSFLNSLNFGELR